MLPGIGFVFDGINAAWYAQEGDYYNAACSLVSALPGAGDALGVFAKTGKSCKLVTAFHKTGSAGNLMIGSYELGKTADKYISGDASFTWEEIKGDLFKVAMTGTSMWGSAKDFGTSYCFVAGTLVTTEDGQEPIEEIEVGDRVLSENELTGEVAVKTVTETYINETDELIHIGVNGETISATPTHPFYVDKLGWTLARSLRAGDVLVLSNGELVTVEWVQHEILESPIKVYNFEVEDFHTYFVGESSVLVHNDCIVGSYKDLKNDNSSGQRHHVSQDAAFGSVIPRNEGLSVKLEGNIFTDTGSAHYNAHKTLEGFWDEYRPGGQKFGQTPTVGQYNRASYDSLVSAGVSKREAASIVRSAYEQQVSYGLTNKSMVPRIPQKIRGI